MSNQEPENEARIGLSDSNAGLGLLPCPFCGSEASIGTDYYGNTFKVQCGNTVQHGCMKSRSRERAIEKWNTRSNAKVSGERSESAGLPCWPPHNQRSMK